MSRVYLIMPSARPPEQCIHIFQQWYEHGYQILIQRDIGDVLIGVPWIQQVVRSYHGYPEAVNTLAAGVLRQDPKAEWLVCAGDDTLPDPNKSAEEIGMECCQHFGEYIGGFTRPGNDQRGTFGVMQPTGDRWQSNGPNTTPAIDLIAGSPWLGREWCRRINGGRGPLWPEYFHCGADEELQLVAQKYGVFWQRPDLTHYHQHWARRELGKRMALASECPEFLKRANSKEEWRRFHAVFDPRKAAGFPGSEPIA